MWAVLLCLIQDPVVIEGWEAGGSKLSRDGSEYVWDAEKGARLSTAAVPKDWREYARVAFKVQAGEDQVLDLWAHGGGASFKRRLDVKGGEWQAVEASLYQFRSIGVPHWSAIEKFEITLRDRAATLRLADLRLIRKKPGEIPEIEPEETLVARVFGPDAKIVRKTTPNFRVYADAPLDGEKLGAALEEFYALVQKTFGLAGTLDYPATLIIAKTRPAYVTAASRTARDVYYGVLDEKSIKAGGYTFENYSFTSYSESHAERRPVFFHEVLHQIVNRIFKLKGPAGATWIEEGICYFLQNEFIRQEDLSKHVGMMLQSPTPLDKFAAGMSLAGSVNLQSMTLAAFLSKGKYKDQRAAAFEALRDGASLKKAVEAALKVPLSDFEVEWKAFCAREYKE